MVTMMTMTAMMMMMMRGRIDHEVYGQREN
jgi:hypothetical protein